MYCHLLARRMWVGHRVTEKRGTGYDLVVFDLPPALGSFPQFSGTCCSALVLGVQLECLLCTAQWCTEVLDLVSNLNRADFWPAFFWVNLSRERGNMHGLLLNFTARVLYYGFPHGARIWRGSCWIRDKHLSVHRASPNTACCVAVGRSLAAGTWITTTS